MEEVIAHVMNYFVTQNISFTFNAAEKKITFPNVSSEEYILFSGTLILMPAHLPGVEHNVYTLPYFNSFADRVEKLVGAK